MSSIHWIRVASVLFISVALAAIGLGCGKDDSNPVAPAGGGGVTADVTIDIVANNLANSYSPSPDTMLAGQTVAWKNVDTITHTATDDAVAFGTGAIAPGATSTPVALTATGTYTYHCTIHPGMIGTLVVRP
jgi:plastocyanin